VVYTKADKLVFTRNDDGTLEKRKSWRGTEGKLFSPNFELRSHMLNGASFMGTTFRIIEYCARSFSFQCRSQLPSVHSQSPKRSIRYVA
jgi:hypothetical protein